MICLADNDIILKLASCDLLSESFEAFGARPDEVFVLPTAIHKLLNPKKPSKARVKPNDPEHARLQEFFRIVQVLSVTPSAEEEAVFNDILGIDPGEAILFSATAAESNSLLATGDKRSLMALSSEDGAVCQRVCAQIAGRVLCFEQTLLRLMNTVGFELVRTRVVPARDCDATLRAVFGSGLEADEQSVREGLANYISHLRTQSGTLLVNY